MMKQYKKVVSLLAKMEENSKKREIKENNALRGHEPKCKVCNSKYQKEIEHIYELKHPYKDIKAYMEDKQEPITEMSISRHFKNHYPREKHILITLRQWKMKVSKKLLKLIHTSKIYSMKQERKLIMIKWFLIMINKIMKNL